MLLIVCIGIQSGFLNTEATLFQKPAKPPPGDEVPSVAEVPAPVQPGGTSAASSFGSLPAARLEGGAASASRLVCPDVDAGGGARETTA